MLECKIGCLGPQRGRLLWVRGKMVLGKIVPGKMVPEKWSPRKMVPEKWSPGKMVPEKNGPRKNSPQENGPGKMVPGKLVPGKNPSKIVPHQKNARKFKRFFHFYRLIALHTQKDVWRLPQDSTYASNWRTLNESRKVCCRVLGFHKLITSEHSTHTHTHTHYDARRSPHDCLFLSFPGTNFPGVIFPVTIFPGDHISGDHFSRGPFFRDSCFETFM